MLTRQIMEDLTLIGRTHFASIHQQLDHRVFAASRHLRNGPNGHTLDRDVEDLERASLSGVYSS